MSKLIGKFEQVILWQLVEVRQLDKDIGWSKITVADATVMKEAKCQTEYGNLGPHDISCDGHVMRNSEDLPIKYGDEAFSDV
jgi:hypothetical protein